MTTYWSEEYVKKSEAEEIIDDLRLKLEGTRSRLQAAESLRSMWAQGHSSDSAAAQSFAAALSQIWQALGATNQTEAMEKLALINNLIASSQRR